ncbi:hypothetical protein GYMLUDRAFT_64930 [Collybiopsis luxurians FD-317 M1]|uniref:JmjC domain-containing protein n=1 Tax=Collybiopsis luxurians FD-317 M1 TaxID=944289 RepID=A0A0D0BNW6_9AGAR|nr:hypothetical protein GYMLUDRAFT_64930 [Collybiopsis luxurians FD-317 M1]
MGLGIIETDVDLCACLDAKLPLVHDANIELKMSEAIKSTNLSAFMLSLGDIKPAYLLQLETLIWKNLVLISRCKITAETMIDNVLNSIVDHNTFASFRGNIESFRAHFWKQFDPVKHHTSFLDLGAIIKEEPVAPSGHLETMYQTPAPTTTSSSFTPLSATESHPDSDALASLCSGHSNPRLSPSEKSDIYKLFLSSLTVDFSKINIPSLPNSLTQRISSSLTPPIIVNSPQSFPLNGANDPATLDLVISQPGIQSVSQIIRRDHLSVLEIYPSPTLDSNLDDGFDLDLDSGVTSTAAELSVDKSDSASCRVVLPIMSPSKDSGSTSKLALGVHGTSIPDAHATPPIQLRQSSRIAENKRKSEENGDDSSVKHLKVSNSQSSRKCSMKTKRWQMKRQNVGSKDFQAEPGRAQANQENKEGRQKVEYISTSEVPRLVICEDDSQQQFSSGPIDLYTTDSSKYFRYRGTHYRADIVEDLEDLAHRVNNWRCKLGLPTGPPSEWNDEMVDPIAISPIAVTHPNAPPIYTNTFDAFYRKSTREVQDILRRFPVVVLSGHEFGDVDVPRIMHDKSKYEEDKTEAVLTQASYEGFLLTDKIVNSLDNPLGGGVPALLQLATDICVAAYQYSNFPTDTYVQLMTWGLLAKANAVHEPHIDCTGMATWVAIEDGLKKWDIAFPPSSAAEAEVGMIEVYAGDMVWHRNYERGWRWVSILLDPGSMLIMRPGTVHSVTTIKDCVALGGHFFTSSTIKYTVNLIFHLFVGSHTVTNSPVDHEQQNLLRILLYWHKILYEGSDKYLGRIEQLAQDTLPHIPNILLFEDFKNLVMLLNYAELVSVVTPARYDSLELETFDPKPYLLPHKCARELRRWLCRHFQLTLEPPADDGHRDAERMEAILETSLLCQAHKLWTDVKQHAKLAVVGSTCSRLRKSKEVVEEITAAQVKDAIDSDLSDFPRFSERWPIETMKTPPPSYAFPSPLNGCRYVVKCNV